MPAGRGAVPVASASARAEVAEPEAVVVHARLSPALARRAAAIRLAGQLPPVVALLAVALPRLTTRVASLDGAFALAEVATAALLLIAIGAELRGKPLVVRLGAVDLAAGCMLLAEWVDAVAHGHKWFSPTFLSAVVTLVVAALPLWRPGYRAGRHLLRVTRDDVAWRVSRFRHFTVAWRDVVRVERIAGRVVLHRSSARAAAIRLGGLENAEEVWGAIAAGAARAGVPVTDDAGLTAIGRREAIARVALLVTAGALVARPLRALPAPGMPHEPHPDPRPGITSARVLPESAIPDRDDTRKAFAAARAWPAIFDGIRCACGCAEGMHHRSLLSCFEEDQGTWCPGCRRQALYVGELAAAGRSLAEIRAAVDARFDG